MNSSLLDNCRRGICRSTYSRTYLYPPFLFAAKSLSILISAAASVEKVFKQYAVAAGIQIPAGIAFDLLRHTAGQQMSELGMGIEEAQAFLGHTNPKTTMVYYAVSDNRLKRVAQRLRYEQTGDLRNKG